MTYPRDDYDNIATRYGVDELDHIHEEYMERDYGKVFFLEYFPLKTSPFWNMRLMDDKVHAHKIDVIIHGIETIGSAERSTDPVQMKEMFYTISDGGYANTLFAQFGKERVEKELEDFLKK